MIFAALPLDEAEGAILAHSLAIGDGGEARRLKKGRILSAEDIAILRAAGLVSVVAARIESGDVAEDAAAARIAEAASGENLEARGPFTGRVNLFATARGLATFDRARLDRVNAIDEAVTIASVPAYAVVEPGQMVATVKIVTFAAPEAVIEEAARVAGQGEPLFRVAPFARKSVGLIQTLLPGTRDKVLDKTLDVTRTRLLALESKLAGELRCAHETEAVRGAIERLLGDGCDLILIVGASAITDRRDVVPAALVAAGGEIEHFGMPVDPGQLLLLGRHGGTPVLGVPGCGRSPKVNGFDWVLQRLCADIPVAGADVMAMGAGGLLAEMPDRPMPRTQAEPKNAIRSDAPKPQRAPRIGAVLLAAGQSRRMGAINKLLAAIEGVPMILRSLDAVLASHAAPVIVVTGHEAERVVAAIGHKRKVDLRHNPAYAEGLSTSLASGLAALPADIDGVLICLGDMPRVSAKEIDRLIDAFNPTEGRAIVVPTHGGKRGNPVLFAKRYFAEMTAVSGDVGARHLIGEHADDVAEVEMADDGVLLDVDSPDALSALHADLAAKEG
jgi:molybdenum cofactor cytidylyltransferase